MAPELAEFGDNAGMGQKVAARLDLNRSSPAFTESITKRNEINSEYAAQKIVEARGFAVGDLVCCRHGEGVLMKLEDDGSCVVKIAFDGITKASKFTSTGRDVGGARLRWPEISFFFPRCLKTLIAKCVQASTNALGHYQSGHLNF